MHLLKHAVVNRKCAVTDFFVYLVDFLECHGLVFYFFKHEFATVISSAILFELIWSDNVDCYLS